MSTKSMVAFLIAFFEAYAFSLVGTPDLAGLQANHVHVQIPGLQNLHVVCKLMSFEIFFNLIYLDAKSVFLGLSFVFSVRPLLVSQLPRLLLVFAASNVADEGCISFSTN